MQKYCACHFPHRHGDATTKPENRDGTCWKLKTNILCMKLTHIFTLCSCSYNIDVYVRVFVTTPKICYLKIDVSCEATCHKMPRLPRNLHVVTTWRGPDNVIRKNTQYHRSKIPRPPRKMKMDTSKVLCLPGKLISSSENDVFFLPVTHVLNHDVTKCHACHTKWRSTTFETSKSDHFCDRHGHSVLIADGCRQLLTVAGGCEHESSVPQTRPNP